MFRFTNVRSPLAGTSTAQAVYFTILARKDQIAVSDVQRSSCFLVLLIGTLAIFYSCS